MPQCGSPYLCRVIRLALYENRLYNPHKLIRAEGLIPRRKRRGMLIMNWFFKEFP